MHVNEQSRLNNGKFSAMDRNTSWHTWTVRQCMGGVFRPMGMSRIRRGRGCQWCRDHGCLGSLSADVQTHRDEPTSRGSVAGLRAAPTSGFDVCVRARADSKQPLRARAAACRKAPWRVGPDFSQNGSATVLGAWARTTGLDSTPSRWAYLLPSPASCIFTTGRSSVTLLLLLHSRTVNHRV